MGEAVRDHFALKWRERTPIRGEDQLAVEEPLEIRLAGRRFTLTMRTPGHDEELVAGFLLSEGFINSRQDLGEIRRLRDSQGRPEPNALDVILNIPAAGLRERLQRNFNISSSCGVCGKSSIEALQRRIPPLATTVRITAGTLFKMPAMMREAQAVFSATGGLHAAALFELETQPLTPSPVVANSPSSEPIARPFAGEDTGAKSDSSAREQKICLVALREDVGRHNAVDKVTGFALLRDNIPLARSVMMVSGRLSFEIVQKAAAAGVEILCAVSAPSSLAVELADEVGMTLVGFLREPNFNVYTAPERIIC
jgi:FdhD protein